MATYTINENTARLSHEMRSWNDYDKGSATREYEAQVAQAAAILEQVKAKCFTEEQKERAEYLLTATPRRWQRPPTRKTRSARAAPA